MEYNFELFNSITDALEVLETSRAILVTAQQNAEEVFISKTDR
jgi:SpoU rRNA methylase family enzyme